MAYKPHAGSNTAHSKILINGQSNILLANGRQLHLKFIGYKQLILDKIIISLLLTGNKRTPNCNGHLLDCMEREQHQDFEDNSKTPKIMLNLLYFCVPFLLTVHMFLNSIT